MADNRKFNNLFGIHNANSLANLDLVRVQFSAIASEYHPPGTVQFGIVHQSHVTRASDVPKYRLRHMSQSPLTKGQNVTVMDP